MAAPTLHKMFGGVVPGGVITITPGTPIPIIQNIAQASGDTTSGRAKTPPYAITCRQFAISVDSSVGGEVYVNYGNFAGKGNQTALIVQSGTTQALPVNSRCVEGLIDATKWYLDGSAACVAAVSFADASS